MVTSSLVKIGEASRLFGISISTLRRWDASGELTPVVLPSGHRLYSLDTLNEYFYGATDASDTAESVVVIYARVSSRGQAKSFDCKTQTSNEDSDISRQVETLKAKATEMGHPEAKVYSDVGSGMNFEKISFGHLIDDCLSGKLDGATILVTYRERLLRFGVSLLERIFAHHNITLLAIETDGERGDDFQVDLAADLVSVITHFTARVSGNKSKKSLTKTLSPEGLERAKELVAQNLPQTAVVSTLNAEGFFATSKVAGETTISRKVLANCLAGVEIEKVNGALPFDSWYSEHVQPAESSYRLLTTTLYDAYQKWEGKQNRKPLSRIGVARLMRQKKLTKKQIKGGSQAFCAIRIV